MSNDITKMNNNDKLQQLQNIFKTQYTYKYNLTKCFYIENSNIKFFGCVSQTSPSDVDILNKLVEYKKECLEYCKNNKDKQFRYSIKDINITDIITENLSTKIYISDDNDIMSSLYDTSLHNTLEEICAILNCATIYGWITSP